MYKITLFLFVAATLSLVSCKKENSEKNIIGEWQIDDEQILYAGEYSFHLGPDKGNFIYNDDGTGVFKYNGSSNPADMLPITWYLSYDQTRISINYSQSSGVTSYEITMPQSDRMTLKTRASYSGNATIQLLKLSKIN